MNIALAILLAIGLVWGFFLFKRNKEIVNEAPRQRHEPDRVPASKLIQASRMQAFWSHQCSKVYKELHK